MEKHQSDLRKVCSQDDASHGSTGSGEKMVTSPGIHFFPSSDSPHQGVVPRDMEWSGHLARTLSFTSDNAAICLSFP